MPGLHHVEIWIPDAEVARREWGWLLERLGFAETARWSEGSSWEADGAYLTFTTSPNLSAPAHAGGPDHYAGWIENADGFKAEIVAD